MLLLTVHHYRSAYFPRQRSMAIERAIAQMWEFDTFINNLDFLKTLFTEEEITGDGRPMGLYVASDLQKYRELLRYLVAALSEIDSQ